MEQHCTTKTVHTNTVSCNEYSNADVAIMDYAAKDKNKHFLQIFSPLLFFLSVHIFAKNMLAGTYFNMNSIKPVSMCDKELEGCE